MPDYRSWTTTHGRNMAGARGLWRATGMTEGDWDKPIIAIVNSFTQFVPGHVHLKDLGQMVAREVESAGGVAKEFNTIAVDDGIHLVSATRMLRRKGAPAPEAAAVALRMKVRPMACTSSILAVFLGLLTLTSFPPVAHFGLLSAMGIGMAFLGAVLALPALLGWGREHHG